MKGLERRAGLVAICLFNKCPLQCKSAVWRGIRLRQVPSGLVSHGPSLAPANGTFLASETPHHCPIWSLLRSSSLGQGRLALVPSSAGQVFPPEGPGGH